MKILFIGSSSIFIFFPLKSDDITVKKIEGANMKSIVNNPEKYLKFFSNEYDYIITFFGQVDIHLYYYYKVYLEKYITNVKSDYNPQNFFKIPEDYIKTINTLNMNSKIFIIVPF